MEATPRRQPLGGNTRDPVRARDADALEAAGRLIAEGRYHEAADALLDLQRPTGADPTGVPGQILAAAHEMCLACVDQRAQISRHQAALNEAVRVESVQQARARALLSLVGSAGEPGGRGSTGADGRLLVRCFGPLAVEWEGAPGRLAWPSRRGKTLFKYLVLQRDRPVPKEVLMDLLWPDAAAEVARRNLNVTVYAVRRTLSRSTGHSSVRFREGTYSLDPDLDAWVDLEDFTRLAASAQRSWRAGDARGFVSAARAAETLYHGDLFEDDLYEEWVQGRRRELREQHLGLLEGLGECHLRDSDYSACAETCHAILADEPERETAHRRLMCCYARQGHRHLAVRQYERCVAAMRTRLGAPPRAETSAVVARIRRGEAV